ncbi:hypothetical protein EJ05DRAFT_490495 [Pseudovirgaria hyperparasitica]|uniref:Uncharacterized protein n=1 Tax=Pseudovirgaria hyperparasitica TaxID=470096 RepID=A0A6A6VTM7_9PEZI|nr:uncharacterized protein EJ05DRAFT_490495 [Pseudovirgaria hyperparasitica]KAF2752960.1 hypothetical protein EJ05DRAFT_490495 [Pseudovirgaria hyperparasitica]
MDSNMVFDPTSWFVNEEPTQAFASTLSTTTPTATLVPAATPSAFLDIIERTAVSYFGPKWDLMYAKIDTVILFGQETARALAAARDNIKDSICELPTTWLDAATWRAWAMVRQSAVNLSLEAQIFYGSLLLYSLYRRSRNVQNLVGNLGAVTGNAIRLVVFAREDVQVPVVEDGMFTLPGTMTTQGLQTNPYMAPMEGVTSPAITASPVSPVTVAVKTERDVIGHEEVMMFNRTFTVQKLVNGQVLIGIQIEQDDIVASPSLRSVSKSVSPQGGSLEHLSDHISNHASDLQGFKESLVEWDGQSRRRASRRLAGKDPEVDPAFSNLQPLGSQRKRKNSEVDGDEQIARPAGDEQIARPTDGTQSKRPKGSASKDFDRASGIAPPTLQQYKQYKQRKQRKQRLRRK